MWIPSGNLSGGKASTTRPSSALMTEGWSSACGSCGSEVSCLEVSSGERTAQG